MASLNWDFSAVPDRTRVRIRQELIGGFDYLALEVEFELSRNIDWGETTNDPSRRMVVPLSQFSMEPVTDPATVRFGSRDPSGTYTSQWETIIVASYDDTIQPVPESSTVLLLGTGLAAAGMRRRMKKRG